MRFDRREDRPVADSDLEPHDPYSYRKTLPTKMRPEKSGRRIIINNPDDFDDWLATSESVDKSAGLLQRLLGR